MLVKPLIIILKESQQTHFPNLVRFLLIPKESSMGNQRILKKVLDSSAKKIGDF